MQTSLQIVRICDWDSKYENQKRVLSAFVIGFKRSDVGTYVLLLFTAHFERVTHMISKT